MDYVYVIIDGHYEYCGTYASKEDAVDGVLDCYILNEGLHSEQIEIILHALDDNSTEVIVKDREHNQSYSGYVILKEEIKGLQ